MALKNFKEMLGRKMRPIDKCLKSLSLSTALTPFFISPCFAQTAASSSTVSLPQVEVVATSPLPSGGEEAAKIPALVQSLSSQAFERTNSPNVTDTLQQRIPAAVAIDINGNDFSQALVYRGFQASPVQGTPQGLAVYQNGIRINEAFGDTVNFDLIPPQAIYRSDVFTNNPIFGLNALGGAVSLQMKNGFLWQGFETQVMGGSYGRVSGMFQYGKQVDNYSFYITGDATHDDGWRFFSPSSLERLYADFGYRTPDAEVHFSASGANSYLGVVGPAPVQLIDNNFASVFTSPQSTFNQVGTLAFSGKFTPNAQWTIASNFYLRAFQQRHTDGNDADLQDCAANVTPNDFAGSLCLNDSNFPSIASGNAFVILDRSGNPIPFSSNAIYGTIDRTSTHATTFGTALQATNNDKLFGHDNYFVFGGSVDRSLVSFSSNSTLGNIEPNLLISPAASFPGAGSIIETLGQIGYVPTYLTGTTTYYGLFALDTFNITPELAATAGARFNVANIVTNDATGFESELNINDRFERLNPVVGATYKILPNLTAYAGYSEANRAPTPLELDCANPLQPCLLQNSLVSDPPLQQVVSHTVEAGFRGNADVLDNKGHIDWQAGFFRTENTNDIISVASVITGRGYYTNVPETLRQGLEAGAQFHMGDILAYANYSFVDATYQFAGTLPSPFNPFANANGNIFVTPGNHIPGVPRNQVKFGADYAFTPQFKLGANAIVVGSQYLIGDNSNLNPKLPAYWVANLHASYQVDEHIQFFGLINNLFNRHYATYGTFFNTGTDAQLATSTFFTGNPRTITPAQPISFYGGVKVTF